MGFFKDQHFLIVCNTSISTKFSAWEKDAVYCVVDFAVFVEYLGLNNTQNLFGHHNNQPCNSSDLSVCICNCIYKMKRPWRWIDAKGSQSKSDGLKWMTSYLSSFKIKTFAG